MKQEYQTGAGARKTFEGTMAKLFRVPKSAIEKPKPKKASAGKVENEK